MACVRECLAGDGDACLNRAWALQRDDCVERLFAMTCDAGEQLGCGMRGRVMMDLAKGDAAVARVRAYLEESCERVKGFACRVLAYHYELGHLGAFDPEVIPVLLARFD